MAKKVMEIVVCDLCKRDRPAVAQVTLDLCANHEHIATTKLEDTYQQVCPECGEKFQFSQGLGVHRKRVHGVVSIKAKGGAKKVKARG